jgi:hypothetical protein
MKKTKQPGENISLKTKKSEDPAVMDWINSQTNLMDSLRYLIEIEIRENGVRNFQTFVPMERNVLTASQPASMDGGTNTSQPSSLRDDSAEDASATGHAASNGRPSAASDRAGHGRSIPTNRTLQPNQSSPLQPAGNVSDGASADDEIDDEDIEAWT